MTDDVTDDLFSNQMVLVYYTLSDKPLHAGVNRLMHVNLNDGSRSRVLVVHGKSRTPAQGHGAVWRKVGKELLGHKYMSVAQVLAFCFAVTRAYSRETKAHTFTPLQQNGSSSFQQ